MEDDLPPVITLQNVEKAFRLYAAKRGEVTAGQRLRELTGDATVRKPRELSPKDYGRALDVLAVKDATPRLPQESEPEQEQLTDEQIKAILDVLKPSLDCPFSTKYKMSVPDGVACAMRKWARLVREQAPSESTTMAVAVLDHAAAVAMDDEDARLPRPLVNSSHAYLRHAARS